MILAIGKQPSTCSFGIVTLLKPKIDSNIFYGATDQINAIVFFQVVLVFMVAQIK